MGVLGIAAVNPPILFSLRLRIRGQGSHAYRNAKKPFNAEPYLQYRPLLEQNFRLSRMFYRSLRVSGTFRKCDRDRSPGSSPCYYFHILSTEPLSEVEALCRRNFPLYLGFIRRVGVSLTRLGN